MVFIAPSSSVTAAVRPAGRLRICLLSEDLSGAPDEGVKKFTLALGAALGARHEVVLLSTRRAASLPNARLTRAGRTFLSARLRRALRALRPDVLLYAARSSTTGSTFLRCRILRAYLPETRLVLIGLQARRHRPLLRPLLRRLSPDLILVQGAASQRYLLELGCPADVIASGVDTNRFRPATNDERVSARAWLGLPPDRPVVLHVGHLRRGRGIGVLADLAGRGRCQVVLVTSTTTALEAEAGLAEELRAAGVLLLTEYLASIERVYQAADCYVFPVESTDNAIETPLSVLEALACNLPVVSTRFGGLPGCFEGAGNPGLVFVESRAALLEQVERVVQGTGWQTRPLVEALSWDSIAEDLIRRVWERGVTDG
jgi:glycosyltransferase involved in cell wall biosynthesis